MSTLPTLEQLADRLSDLAEAQERLECLAGPLGQQYDAPALSDPLQAAMTRWLEVREALADVVAVAESEFVAAAPVLFAQSARNAHLAQLAWENQEEQRERASSVVLPFGGEIRLSEASSGAVAGLTRPLGSDSASVPVRGDFEEVNYEA